MTSRKPAEERKRQIMAAAEHLFVTQGFEATSVNDILRAVGIAKGTFYHHFPAKEAVMDAIIDHYVELIRERTRQVLDQPGLPVHQKLFGVVLAARVQGEGQSGLLDELHRPENAAFHLRSQQRTLETVLPILADIIREGVGQGIFATDYPEEAIEMILLYANIAFDDLAVAEPAQQARKARAFLHHTELLLGAEPGSFDYLAAGLAG